MHVCILCNSGEVGDEFHYLFNCIEFKYERQKFIPNYYHIRPNTLKYSEMFNTKNQQKLSNLANFVKIITAKCS